MAAASSRAAPVSSPVVPQRRTAHIGDSAVVLTLRRETAEFYWTLLVLKALAERKKEYRGLQAQHISLTFSRLLLPPVSIHLSTSSKFLLDAPSGLRFSSAFVWSYSFDVNHEEQRLSVSFVRRNCTDELVLDHREGRYFFAASSGSMGSTQEHTMQGSPPRPCEVLESIFNPGPWLLDGRAVLLWPKSVSRTTAALLSKVSRQCLSPPWRQLPEGARDLLRRGFVCVLAKDRAVGSEVQVPQRSEFRTGFVTFVCALIYSEENLKCGEEQQSGGEEKETGDGQKGEKEEGADDLQEQEEEKRRGVAPASSSAAASSSVFLENKVIDAPERSPSSASATSVGQKEKAEREAAYHMKDVDTDLNMNSSECRLFLQGVVAAGGLGSERDVRDESQAPKFRDSLPDFPSHHLTEDIANGFLLISRPKPFMTAADFRPYLVRQLKKDERIFGNGKTPSKLPSVPAAQEQANDMEMDCLDPLCVCEEHWKNGDSPNPQTDQLGVGPDPPRGPGPSRGPLPEDESQEALDDALFDLFMSEA
uniref:Uncharacterized protein n=1 Tax=Chromera velia CCMP2878 TaxID=1169474 RepID=A0A0G4H8P1_9ALVE|eukprot:Cvel_868.t1-p1 / transcript=Cvel_868.t1 / gene=Cvel_868 / organism=Chromera_velia_CCMP2878 / gene_product=hypothetical protein / transcript_product=hypothetical protein / location=Cvel_scaffold27:71029-72630(-) / protein_length=534 / sequence_SO=supercontig / SO=protein_coding / is_pseudo=false